MTEPTKTESTKTESTKTESTKTEPTDPNWWTPWAVLLGLLIFGLLGFLGLLTPKRAGPTAADVTEPAPSASTRLHVAKP